MSEAIPTPAQPQFEITHEVGNNVMRVATAIAGLEPGPDGPMVASQMAGNYANNAHLAHSMNPTPATAAELFLSSAMLAGVSEHDATTMNALDVMGSLAVLDDTEASVFSGMIVNMLNMRHQGQGVPGLQDQINTGINQNLLHTRNRDTPTAHALSLALLAAGVGANAGRSYDNPWYGGLRESLVQAANKEQ